MVAVACGGDLSPALLWRLREALPSRMCQHREVAWERTGMRRARSTHAGHTRIERTHQVASWVGLQHVLGLDPVADDASSGSASCHRGSHRAVRVEHPVPACGGLYMKYLTCVLRPSLRAEHSQAGQRTALPGHEDSCSTYLAGQVDGR